MFGPDAIPSLMSALGSGDAFLCSNLYLFSFSITPSLFSCVLSVLLDLGEVFFALVEPPVLVLSRAERLSFNLARSAAKFVRLLRLRIAPACGMLVTLSESFSDELTLLRLVRDEKRKMFDDGIKVDLLVSVGLLTDCLSLGPSEGVTLAPISLSLREDGGEFTGVPPSLDFCSSVVRSLLTRLRISSSRGLLIATG